MKTIAIVGGIGSGKSVVANIIKSLGYDVYDCDSRAKYLMDCTDEIKRQLITKISPNTVTQNNQIDRPTLAKIVFNNSQKLTVLNRIVHHAVLDDFCNWRENLPNDKCLVETSILYESGLHKLVNQVWEVTAPIDLRISRVMCRNNMSRADVEARIKSQPTQPAILPTTQIINDDKTPILPQIENLIHRL